MNWYQVDYNSCDPRGSGITIRPVPLQGDYVQRALDAMRVRMVELGEKVEVWDGQPDLLERVRNWHEGTWREMEEILQWGDSSNPEPSN